MIIGDELCWTFRKYEHTMKPPEFLERLLYTSCNLPNNTLIPNNDISTYGQECGGHGELPPQEPRRTHKYP